MKMLIQKKETFKKVLFWSSVVICPLLIGCRDRFADYYNRGIDHLKKGEYDQAISCFDKALEINPRHADAYNNRTIAYYTKGEYHKAWEDVHKAQCLGHQIHPEFLKKLREDSGRESP